MTRHEEQDDLLNDLNNFLENGGWTITRNNTEGGTLVAERSGIRAVVGAHLYDIKDLSEDVVQHGRLLPAASDAGLVGFVIENEDGLFWDGEQFQDMLNDGAEVHGAQARINKILPEGGKWAVVYAHATDGCLTTEACSGVDTCQDCLDVRQSCGEDVEALIAAQQEPEAFIDEMQASGPPTPLLTEMYGDPTNIPPIQVNTSEEDDSAQSE